VQEVKAVTRMSCEYPSIRFAYNAALLDPEARAALDDLALCLKEGTARILIEGHCDERGSEEWNLQLGEERARSVKKYLAAKGVDDARIELLSKGETEPLDSGSSEEAWSRNRRAEFETR
jgi:peptidoglycan-associated lipoprotein